MQNFDDSFLQLLLVSVLSCHGVSVVSECAALSPSGSCRTSYHCVLTVLSQKHRGLFLFNLAGFHGVDSPSNPMMSQ